MYIKNALGRTIPSELSGNKLLPYLGPGEGILYRKNLDFKSSHRSQISSKLVSLEEAVKRSGIKDGMTVSFHHHLRNGDYVINLVLSTLARMGIKDLRLAPSAIFPIHAPLVEMMHQGVISRIDTSYMTGPVANAVSRGVLKEPVIFRTHGGRPRAIESGELEIDIAFIAAPAADEYGNANGVIGKSRCGPLGYAVPDAVMAKKTVVITDNLMPYPLYPISISQKYVDYVVVIDEIGDPRGIVFGTTRITTDPLKLRIAEAAAEVVFASGLFNSGFSFQTGGGGISLAAAKYVHERMKREGIVGSFGAGGITTFFVQMLNEGLFRCLLDLQSLDLEAVDSLSRNPNHIEVDASFYANPWNKGCWVDKLDVMILGATEVDVNFNVNVLTASDGRIMGGSGGHTDTAAGARLAIVVIPTTTKGIPRVVNNVKTIVTPGEYVDAVVTEEGVAINPRRHDLYNRIRGTGVVLRDINELREISWYKAGCNCEETEEKAEGVTPVVGIVENRDGTIIDIVRAISLEDTR